MPSHVLQAHYFSVMVAYMVYLIMAVLADGDSILADGLDSQGASAHVCLHQSVGLAVKISHLLALLMLQLERLLAVTRPFLSEAFTVSHCGLAIVASGLLTLTITVIGVFVEREFLYCQSQAMHLLTSPVSILVVSYPTLLAIVFTLLVSAVLRHQVQRLNSVQPQVQLQPQPHQPRQAWPEQPLRLQMWPQIPQIQPQSTQVTVLI